jgi:hypothetical protein
MSSLFDRYENLKREEYQLPSTVEEILDVLRSTMSSGSPVRKVVVEESRPILVYRDMTEGELEELETTLDGALRNSKVIEYLNDDPRAVAEMLYDMQHVLHMHGLYAVCWAVGPMDSDKLEAWLRMDERGMPTPPGFQLTQLGGFPVRKVRSLPEDVIILCGARYKEGDVNDIELGVKTNIELKEESDARLESSAARHPVRDDPGGDAPATRVVEAPARVRKEAGWVPTGILGARMADRRRVR